MWTRPLRQLVARLHAVRLGAWPEQAGQDLRYGARIFVRRPGFTLAATRTLALVLARPQRSTPSSTPSW